MLWISLPCPAVVQDIERTCLTTRWPYGGHERPRSVPLELNARGAGYSASMAGPGPLPAPLSASVNCLTTRTHCAFLRSMPRRLMIQSLDVFSNIPTSHLANGQLQQGRDKGTNVHELDCLMSLERTPKNSGCSVYSRINHQLYPLHACTDATWVVAYLIHLLLLWCGPSHSKASSRAEMIVRHLPLPISFTDCVLE